MANDTRSRQAEVDRLMAQFMKCMAMEKYLPPTSPPPAPRLTVVTADNAHTFKPAPKRRGRPAKVKVGGNVVAFRQPAASPSAPDTPLERQRKVVIALLEDRRKKSGLPPGIDYSFLY